MIESHIFEIDGIFLGLFIKDCTRCEKRFYAVHDAVKSFHNHVFDRSGILLQEISRQFRRIKSTGASI